MDKWVCSCGTVNSGAFCAGCGRARADVETGATSAAGDVVAQVLQAQHRLRQSEIDAENERRKQQDMEEQARAEYNAKCETKRLDTLKKWGSSWVVLTLAILVSAALAFTLISTFTGFTKGAFKIIANLIKVLIAALVCAGFWKAYSACRKQGDNFDAGGISMLRGVLTYKKIMMFISMISIILVSVLVFVLLKTVTDVATDTADKVTGADTSDINMSITTILVIMLVMVIVAFAVQIVYYNSVWKFADQVLTCFKNKRAPVNKVTLAAVFFFIIGACTLAFTIARVSSMAFVGKLLDSIVSSMGSAEGGEKIGSVFSSLGSLIQVDWFAAISDFVGASTFILAGVLALRFNKIGEVMEKEITTIPVTAVN